MARARALVALALAALATSSPAHAAGLARLSVTTLTLGADTTAPVLETPFHLIVTAHVRERVAQFNNLDLPILAELELLGDEHRVTSDATGTTYRETITVVAHHTGDITIAPVTLDAIDPHDNHGKRYSSNALTISVGGGGLVPLPSARDAVMATVVHVAYAIFWLMCFASVVLLALVIFRRRRRPIVTPPPEVQHLPTPVPVQVRSQKERLHDAYLTLRADPTRANAMRVRSMVRRMIGATERETLDDVMKRPSANEPTIAPVLKTLERAAFTYDADLSTAIAAALLTLERASA